VARGPPRVARASARGQPSLHSSGRLGARALRTAAERAGDAHLEAHGQRHRVAEVLLSAVRPDRVLEQNWDKWQDTSNKRHGEYGGLSREEVKSKWAEVGRDAAVLGTAMHRTFELFYTEGRVDDGSFAREWEQFMHFTEHVCPVGNVLVSEMRLFSPKHRLCGTADVIAKGSAPGSVIIYDFKRSKHACLENEHAFNEWGYPPCNRITANNHGTYRVQLNLYAAMLEANYGVTVEKMFLVRCHATAVVGCEAEVIEVAPCPEVVAQVLARRERKPAVQGGGARGGVRGGAGGGGGGGKETRRRASCFRRRGSRRRSFGRRCRRRRCGHYLGRRRRPSRYPPCRRRRCRRRLHRCRRARQ